MNLYLHNINSNNTKKKNSLVSYKMQKLKKKILNKIKTNDFQSTFYIIYTVRENQTHVSFKVSFKRGDPKNYYATCPLVLLIFLKNIIYTISLLS